MKATPYNQKMIDEFHAKKGLGVGPFGDHVLLLTAKGAKSGEHITTPLVYRREGDTYVVIASKGGAPTHPLWFTNIQVDPDVEVEVASAGATETFRAHARVQASGPERDRLYTEQAKVWPAFLEYQKKTSRVIPVVVLERQK
ncbi:MAG: nitroreductase family deazaflavin-dependent oxidoreductase [Candidatus Dormibacteraeota bacterium]|nr:nitroreductase family deazaflavin-dependent oxidoreductase [Candidatus Dormibacteraeota bacterium]